MKATVAVGLMAAVLLAGCSRKSTDDPLTPARTIALEGVSGRIDHMAVDVEGKRLFIAAVGNNTVEVVDLASGKQAGRIKELNEPQGVLFVPDLNRIVVANGGDGTVRFYDGKSLALIKSVDLKEDADNLRYDAAAKRVYVGYGSGAIGVLNAETGERLADIKLSGHPESFQLEGKGKRIFVNVPTARQVAVIDRDKAAVIAAWPLEGVRSNFPMALDEENHRLFVGCRSPAKLVVVDTESGKSVASLDCAGDVDDVFYDAASKRIYLSGGQGKIDIFEQANADHYTLISETSTATGARTSFLVPQMKMFYVALPRQLLRSAELRAYEVK